jgi:hypothetical protein
VGGYETPQEAAVARDRMALYYVDGEPFLNFPERQVAPASERELRREVRAARALAKSAGERRSPKSSSGLTPRPQGSFGVIYDPARRSRRWTAAFTPPKSHHFWLGCWLTEREAALAHDRAALFYVGERYRWINDVVTARRAGPADAATLRAEALAQIKRTTTSRFRGVSWSSRDGLWGARISQENRTLPIGRYDIEEEAAHAYDVQASKLHGKRAYLNFHPRTGEELRGLKRFCDVEQPLRARPRKKK